MSYATQGRRITAPAGDINDTAERATYRKVMERACIKHAQAIIFSGKAYGPCDPDALLSYAAPQIKKKRMASNAAMLNRRTALSTGAIHYEGDKCAKCGTTRRYTRNRTCIECTRVSQRVQHNANAQAERERIDRAMLGECMEIAERHGYAVAQIKGDSREPGLVDCRHEIFAAMFSAGYSFSKIGEWWGRDRSTITHAIAKHYPSLMKSNNRVRRLQNMESDARLAA